MGLTTWLHRQGGTVSFEENRRNKGDGCWKKKDSTPYCTLEQHGIFKQGGIMSLQFSKCQVSRQTKSDHPMSVQSMTVYTLPMQLNFK